MAKRRRTEGEEAGEPNGLDGNPAEQPHSALVNSAARAETIREACMEISEFEKQAKGLKAEIKAIVETRIVAGLGMKKSDFTLARKLYELDKDDRDGVFDAIREVHAALGVGETVDWVKAAEAADAAATA